MAMTHSRSSSASSSDWRDGPPIWMARCCEASDVLVSSITLAHVGEFFALVLASCANLAVAILLLNFRDVWPGDYTIRFPNCAYSSRSIYRNYVPVCNSLLFSLCVCVALHWSVIFAFFWRGLRPEPGGRATYIGLQRRRRRRGYRISAWVSVGVALASALFLTDEAGTVFLIVLPAACDLCLAVWTVYEVAGAVADAFRPRPWERAGRASLEWEVPDLEGYRGRRAEAGGIELVSTEFRQVV